ncbi:SDR family NAD(P)-dependent oxidoreductase [Kribbella italica]|uniref:Uncharacterized protein YbjT (DUF2867 family) n=1 Tax=Kribbella italica TaxID=1540520 RepID=A0A7W9J528_9ACTN|nr:uncharacterized protein YbjT (DUF2867 family) [Kribbella italica]
MKVLVTGATGNIGREVVRLLSSAGVDVRAMSRTPDAARALLGSATGGAARVEVVRGDFGEPESWAAALSGVDRAYVFPFAYVAGAGAGFVAEAVRHGVSRFVVHSAAAAGFAPVASPVDALQAHLEEERAAHRAVEVAVEATGAEWTHVRPGLLAVNSLGWAPAIKAKEAVRAPYGEAGYPWVHEVDVAEIAVQALVTDELVGRACTITGPARVSQVEQVRAIGAALGRDVAFEELTPEQAKEQWRLEGCPEEYLAWRLAVLADALDGCGALPPTEDFERITGRVPRSFAQWAVDHQADFR